MKFKIKDRNFFNDEDAPFKKVGLKEKLIDLWEYKIYYPFHWYVKNPYQDHLGGFWRRIKQVIDYVPILWYNYDWDYTGIFELLKKKLERMHEIHLNGCLVTSDTTAKEIKTCILLLDRIIEDDYGNYKRHEKRFGKPKFYFKPIEGSDMLTLEDLNPGSEKKDYSKSLVAARKRDVAQRDQDIELLFKIMNKKILHWWD